MLRQPYSFKLVHYIYSYFKISQNRKNQDYIEAKASIEAKAKATFFVLELCSRPRPRTVLEDPVPVTLHVLFYLCANIMFGE